MALQYLAKRLAPAMVEAGKGAIIATGNTSALRGKANFAGFAPTKAAQRILAEAIARELGPKGVHVAYVVIDAVIDLEWTRAMTSKPAGDPFFIQPSAIVDFAREDVVKRITELTGGAGVDAAIEALGSEESFQNAIKVTKPGGSISNAGYHGKGDFVSIPRLDWGVGMAEKTIRTLLCPGGRLRMERMLRLLQNHRLDPTKMTTHTFKFDELEHAFEMMDKKLDGIIKPLITF
jgi:Zn-dependent alcohol dehydrogenase